MRQDLQYLYRVAHPFVHAFGVLGKVHELSRYADRMFSPTEFYEKYRSELGLKLKQFGTGTLGAILALGVAEKKLDRKAGPLTVGQAPRVSFYAMKPEERHEDFYFRDKSGAGFLQEHAARVILATMLDITYQHVSKLDAAKGVHVLDLVEHELAGWEDGNLSLNDLRPVIFGMVSQGQTEAACKAAWAACNQPRFVHMAAFADKDGALKLVRTVAHSLWREGWER